MSTHKTKSGLPVKDLRRLGDNLCGTVVFPDGEQMSIWNSAGFILDARTSIRCGGADKADLEGAGHGELSI